MSRSRRKLVAFEALENRSLMATDFSFALHLETMDMQDRPISQINIGAPFKLRLTAEELNPVLSLDRGIGGYVGLTFDPSLVEKNGAVNYANAYSINRHLEVIAPGVWENLGALPDLFNPEFTTPPRPRFQWEIPMIAKAGEVEPMFPGFQVQQDEVKVSFDRYSLAVPEIILFRQKMVGSAPGQLKLNINDARLDLPEVGPESVNLKIANVEIVAKPQITEQRLDVSGNGEITPLDVLLVINHLNLRSSDGEEVAKAATGGIDALDVNQDGGVSPLDALLIINRLNAKFSNTSASVSIQAEGEADTQFRSSFVFDLEAIDSHDNQTRFGANRKGVRPSRTLPLEV